MAFLEILVLVCGVLAIGSDGASGGWSVYDIGFSSAASETLSVVNDQVILYQHVFLNVGNGYSGTTGVFTCPHSGMYQFNIHSLSASSEDGVQLNLIHNEKVVASLYVHGTWNAAGNSAVIHLMKGDKMLVKSDRSASIFGSSTSPCTTFSGFLIKPFFGE